MPAPSYSHTSSSPRLTLPSPAQIYGTQLLISNGLLNMTSVGTVCGAQGCGVIHDLYNPGNVDIINTLVDYSLHNTSAGIPILFVEEVS